MHFHRHAALGFLTIRHLSRSELADLAGISPAYVTELLKGDKKRPSAPTVRKIAEALDVDPRALSVTLDEPAVRRAAGELGLEVRGEAA